MHAGGSWVARRAQRVMPAAHLIHDPSAPWMPTWLVAPHIGAGCPARSSRGMPIRALLTYHEMTGGQRACPGRARGRYSCVCPLSDPSIHPVSHTLCVALIRSFVRTGMCVLRCS